MLVFLFLALITFIVWELFQFYRRKASLPPGPFAIPLLGNFINEVCMSWSKGIIESTFFDMLTSDPSA